MLIIISLLTLPAFAAADFDPDWETACSKRCVRDGFTIEVLASTVHSGSMIRFWDGTGRQYIDSAHYQNGDDYLGYQSTSAPLAGGPYCTSYPGAAGHMINGNVYERLVDQYWGSVETGSLSLAPDTACDGTIDWLLDTLDLYGVGDFNLPMGCSDIGCASGGTGDGSDDPGDGPGVWEFTDAAGEVHDLDELWGEDGSSPTVGKARRR